MNSVVFTICAKRFKNRRLLHKSLVRQLRCLIVNSVPSPKSKFGTPSALVEYAKREVLGQSPLSIVVDDLRSNMASLLQKYLPQVHRHHRLKAIMLSLDRFRAAVKPTRVF